MKVYLIAGHGAGDVGAVGNGFKEYQLTREVCQNVKKYLELMGVSCAIGDTSLNWYEHLKTNYFDFSPADFVLEIHFNSATSAQAHGVECYYPTGVSDTSIHNRLCKGLSDNLGFHNRGVKHYDFSVIRKIAKQGVKCGLLEVCFISNVDNMLRYSQNREKVWKTIAEAITGKVGYDNMEQLEKRFKALESKLASLEKYSDTKVYNYVDENMPEAYRATIKKLTRQGIIKGTSSGLELSDRMCRILVYLDRAGIFG